MVEVGITRYLAALEGVQVSETFIIVVKKSNHGAS